ncbi:MAG: T9SS type A sorting domain-containing protein [bacterium]
MRYLRFIFLPIFLFTSPVYANENYSLAVHKSANLDSMRNSIKLIESHGGRIIHVFPPHILIGYFPPNIQARDVGLKNIYSGIIDSEEVADLGEETIFAVKVWNLRFKEVPKAPPIELEPGPIENDCLIWHEKRMPTDRRPLRAPPYGASFYETSEYMIGKIAVGIILPESNGGSENWDSAEETNVVNEIMASLDWWANKEPTAYLSFTYELHKKVATTYEPITLKQPQESLWIKQTIDQVHPNSYTSHLDKVTDYDNYLRDTYQTHWATTIFVVDSSNDSDGKFADGYFAYAYLGGPFIVMTYKNDGYGINNMDAVCAHEMGHIFYALDEYSGSGSSANESSGYLNIVNGNFEVGGIIDVPCIMRGQITPYTQGAVCLYTRQQIGWRDTDGDDKLDIVDTYPISLLQTYIPDPTTDNTPTYNGDVWIDLYPNNNPKGHGNNISINSISNVQYRINGGGWQNAVAKDGAFDEPLEGFYFTTPPLSPGTYLFEVQSSNSCGTQSIFNTQQPPYSTDSLTIIGTQSPPGSQTITGSVLKITVFDDGAMGVWKKDGNNWVRQIFEDNSKGSVLFLAGTNTNYRYASRANKFDCTPIQFTSFSNTMPGSFTIITEYDAADTGVRIKQITTYNDGTDYYKMEWQITNSGTITYNNVRFFHGEDVQFEDYDESYGHWINGLNMVYVTSGLPTKTGIMGLSGGVSTPATSYYEDVFNKVTDQTKTGSLPDTVNSSLHNGAYVIGWQKTALVPGKTWQIEAYERITKGGNVIVSVPPAQNSPPENTLTYYFNIYNNETTADTFNLFAESSHLWTIQICDISNNPTNTVYLEPGTSATIKLLLTVPADAKVGTVDLLSLTAISRTNPLIAGTATTLTTVIPSDLDHIKINPATATVVVCTTKNFTAQGYDKYDNLISDLMFSWATNIGTITPQIGSITTFTAGITPSLGTITACFGSITGTAVVEVIPASLDYIQIIPASATLAAGETIPFYAQGYDKYHNLIPDIIYNWSVDNIGSITPTVGSSTLFTATITSTVGRIMVIADGKNAYAYITITSGQLHHINILPATQTVGVLGSCNFLAQGCDKFNNPIPDLTYQWQVDPFIGSITPQIGSLTTFTAGTKAGVATLTVTSNSIKQESYITITPEILWRLEVVPPSLIISINKEGTFTTRGYDRYDNIIPNIICNWDVLPQELGRVNPAVGTSTTFTANFSVMQGIIKATSDSIIGTATIQVYGGELDHFDFEPISHQIGGMPFPATITARDSYDNLVSFAGEISLSEVQDRMEIMANGKFDTGIWTGTITISGVSLDIQLVCNYGNIRGTSNLFAVLIDDDYGTITVTDNTILALNPQSLKGKNYYVMIDINPQSPTIDNANLKDDQEPKFDRIGDSIREITIVDGDKKSLNYEFGNTTILTIYYQDKDQDGIIDGTNILEKGLKMFALADNRWKEVSAVSIIVDPIDNRVICPISCMGTYVLMGYAIQPNLSNVVVYPVPFKPQRGDREIVFEGLAKDSTIRIYDLSGSLRRLAEHIDSYWCWDVRDDFGKPLESGVYIYIITDNKKGKKTGKIVIIR